MPAFINGCITNLIRNPACLPPDISGNHKGLPLQDGSFLIGFLNSDLVLEMFRRLDKLAK